MSARPQFTDTSQWSRRARASSCGVVWAAGALLSLALLLAGCSSSRATSAEPAGYTRNPVPSVADVAVPVADASTPWSLTAPKGGLHLVFLGFTSCPFECPTTLSNLKRAVLRLPEQDRSKVSVGLLSVDLARDTPTKLAVFVGGRLPGPAPEGVGLLAPDDASLRKVTDALGASYSATPNSDGTPNITHTNEIYAIDDQGNVVRQWPFSASPEALASELDALLAGRRSLG